MSGETLQVTGSLVTTPATTGGTAGQLVATVDQTLQLAHQLFTEYDLASDAPVAVALGGLTNVHALLVQSTSKVRVRVTTADGTTQAVPCDPVLLVVSRATPITAVELTRVAGVAAAASVFLGEKTP